MAATKYAVQELFAMRTDEKTEEMLKRISIEPGIRGKTCLILLPSAVHHSCFCFVLSRGHVPCIKVSYTFGKGKLGLKIGQGGFDGLRYEYLILGEATIAWSNEAVRGKFREDPIFRISRFAIHPTSLGHLFGHLDTLSTSTVCLRQTPINLLQGFGMEQQWEIAGLPAFRESVALANGSRMDVAYTDTGNGRFVRRRDIDVHHAQHATARLVAVTQTADQPLTRKLTFAEHVLARNARLGPPRPHSRGRMSSTAAPTSINGYELPPNDDFYLQGKQPMRAPRFARNSPTASIRGRKAKAFLEQHGSPPGHRVTAGGRIVPDGAWPVTSPNKYPAVPVMNPKTIPDGAVDHLQGVLVDIGNDNICQIINGGFVYVGKKNGHLWLVTRPTNNTLSMNGVPLHNSVHPGMPVAMNHYGNGGETSPHQFSLS